ncbi:MAG: DUF4340 domain-containing protein, partial [Pirellula sp.]|nr:DUF4340 domain-containing protein [Pirellula sp.]
KIVKFDPNQQATVEFEVAKDSKSGLWSIPSREGYPADASKQMAEAATLFIGLKSLDVASEKRTDQELFGVLEPSAQREQGGDGVGMLVQMRDSKNNMLVDIIIGKETDDKKRFLRAPNEDVIYVADINTQPLSTDFKQWIEGDLLKLSSNDIDSISIKDYQLLPTNQGLALSRNYEADINFLSATGQWAPKQITTYGNEGKVDRVLKDDEQLNANRLNEIKSTLDRLILADVAKKPTGLASDLKGNRKQLGDEALVSLAKRGFYPDPQQKEGDVVEFYAENGELIVSLRNGVQYVLRLGGSAGADMSQPIDANEEGKISINRYLLVTCRLDDSKIPEAVIEKVPETVEELKALEALKKDAGLSVPGVGAIPFGVDAPMPAVPQASGAEPPVAPPATETPVKDPATADPVTAPGSEPPAAPEKTVPATGDGTVPPSVPATDPPQPPANDPPKEPVAQVVSSSSTKLVSVRSQDGDQPPAEAVPQQAAQPTQEAASPVALVPGNPAEQDITEEEWKERLAVKKEEVTKSNQRKLEERAEKLNLAKNKVAELNRRFADWYYIISEEDYRKLKIKEEDLIQPKSATPTPPAAPAGLPQF